MIKKGDTLIEVTLAIGIFSMVAIAITSVMSGSSANTQTALEATLAREEIDTQAESLRFIQSSYAANKSVAGNSYASLWQKIKDISYSKTLGNDLSAVTTFSPTNCAELYNDANLNKAFFIDPEKLATSNTANALVNYNSNKSKFLTTQTFPRLSNGTAYGLYVISVPEQVAASKTPTYYDFYIRTCWYGSNANEPSTIYTVIRLYNPDSV